MSLCLCGSDLSVPFWDCPGVASFRAFWPLFPFWISVLHRRAPGSSRLISPALSSYLLAVPKGARVDRCPVLGEVWFRGLRRYYLVDCYCAFWDCPCHGRRRGSSEHGGWRGRTWLRLGIFSALLNEKKQILFSFAHNPPFPLGGFETNSGLPLRQDRACPVFWSVPSSDWSGHELHRDGALLRDAAKNVPPSKREGALLLKLTGQPLTNSCHSVVLSQRGCFQQRG